MKIHFELSPDPKLLEQYYDLRGRCYRDELKLAGFDGGEEPRDRHSHILIAHRNRKCLGGIRITRVIHIVDKLPTLPVPLDRCCVWERGALHPEYRSPDLALGFCENLLDASRELGFVHAAALSSLRNARFYRKCHSILGVECCIQQKLKRPPDLGFAGLEHYISITNLQPEAAPVKLAA